MPSRRQLHRLDGVEPAARQFGASQWVLSRALCRFNRFDLARLPAAKRKAALALQLPQWSPYPDSDYAVVWQEGIASVWCWDNALVDAEIRKHGKNPKKQQKIPESLLRSPLQDGLRLIKCLDGIEGQHWQQGQLLASRWWPGHIGSNDWLAFQRECGIPGEQQQAEPALAESPLQPSPWSKITNPAAASGEVALAELAFHGLLICALGLPTIYLGIQQHQIKAAIAARQAELTVLKHKASAILSARGAALESLTALKAIYDHQRYPEPLELMAAVSRSLPGNGTFVREWEMLEDRLKITVSSPGSAIVGTTYVDTLEKTGQFADVKIITNTDPKLMTFTMTVLPLGLAPASPPKPTDKNADAATS